MTIIKIENLCFSVDEHVILKEINTEINKGEIMALIGPNGSGKSTLMKCVNKVQEAASGNIFLDGKNVKDLSYLEIAKKIAYVPQHEIKASGVSVFDMILTGRMPYITWKPSEEDYKKVAEVMEILKISGMAMKDFKDLSGGQQQMVYIARAIVQETPIIILDEPTNNLDIKHQIEIMKLLKLLSEQGKTIIITLHDVNLVLQYCSKYVLLKSGQIFAQGSQEIINVKNMEHLFEVKMKQIKDEENFYIMPF